MTRLKVKITCCKQVRYETRNRRTPTANGDPRYMLGDTCQNVAKWKDVDGDPWCTYHKNRANANLYAPFTPI